jgi:hypothetical protein
VDYVYPLLPNSFKVTYCVPELVPRTKVNCEPGDYGSKTWWEMF